MSVVRTASLGLLGSLVLASLACGGGTAGTTDEAGASEAGADAGAGDGSTSDGATKPVCTRNAQAKTAPTSLYDALVADLAALADDQKAARVDQFIGDVEAQGGTPLEEFGDRLVFVARGAPPLGPWSIAGSFTGWKANPQPMTQVSGTDLYVLDAHVARGTAHQYKLLSGTTDSGFMEDPHAHNVWWDGIDHGTVGYFNAIAHPGDGDASTGRIEVHHGVHSTKLDDARDVFVYLPARYDDGSCDALPHIVFHDGNESLTRGDFAGVADTTYAASPSASAVLAFVALPSQDVRTDEYTFGTQTALGDEYGAFLTDDLEPLLAKDYRLCAAPTARGIAGASLGGLISTYLAFQRSDVWGYVGSQSGSYFWDSDALITRASQDPVVPVHFYLDTGCPDANDNCTVVQQMNQSLSNKSYGVVYVEQDGAQHDWPYWAARLPKLLGSFAPVCQ